MSDNWLRKIYNQLVTNGSGGGGGGGGDASAANQVITNTSIGATNEAAAASDSATSGLNGLLKRLLGKFPASLGQKADTASLSVVPANGAMLTTAAAALFAINTDLITGNSTAAANSWTDVSGYQVA